MQEESGASSVTERTDWRGGTVVVVNECVHGMNPDWCGICKEPRGSVYSGHGVSTAGGRTKQDELNLLCDQLRLPREPIGEGSSLPSEVFEQIQIRFGLPRGSMPEVAQSAAEAAGLPWSPEFDSRSSLSGGGSTVTFDGLVQLNRAIAALNRES